MGPSVKWVRRSLHCDLSRIVGLMVYELRVVHRSRRGAVVPKLNNRMLGNLLYQWTTILLVGLEREREKVMNNVYTMTLLFLTYQGWVVW